MKPEQARRFLHAYVDGELDLATSLELEAYLAENPDARAECDRLRELSSSIRANANYYRAPDSLRSRLKGTAPVAPVAAGAPVRSMWPIAAALAASVVLTWTLATHLAGPSDEERLVQEVVTSHVRATLGSHLTDVASSDQHTVKPWFGGKLDFSPPVKDLAANGFDLAGGRLEYVAGRVVAAIVYRHRQHVVNVFIWPSSIDEPLRTEARQGFNVAHFARGGMNYWLVSDLNQAELSSLAQALPERTPSI